MVEQNGRISLSRRDLVFFGGEALIAGGFAYIVGLSLADKVFSTDNEKASKIITRPSEAEFKLAREQVDDFHRRHPEALKNLASSEIEDIVRNEGLFDSYQTIYREIRYKEEHERIRLQKFYGRIPISVSIIGTGFAAVCLSAVDFSNRNTLTPS